MYLLACTPLQLFIYVNKNKTLLQTKCIGSLIIIEFIKRTCDAEDSRIKIKIKIIISMVILELKKYMTNKTFLKEIILLRRKRK